MARSRFVAPISIAATLFLATSSADAAERRISRSTLEDRIRGGWAGQMIGVAFGAPTEFRWNGRILEGPIAWTPAQVAGAINQDDLYVEMTFAEVLDRLGLDARARDFGAMFRDSQYELWHANAAARRLLQNGLDSPATGIPENNPHANDIDFQIESDFIGLMTPGLPREANRFAAEVGRVMNAGDGLYGGMFFSGMYAAAFFESDPRKVVEEGLRSIPAESGYARIVRDVLSWSRDEADWKKTWQRIEDEWDRDDLCPEGALQDFNIDARLNGAYVVLGLVYGGGDFSRTLDVATRAGQDSDCNPSSAAGILGTMVGYSRIPDEWKSGIPAIAGTRFAYTHYSFDEIVASTMNRALAVVVRAGGHVQGDEVVIPVQSPEAPPLEQWEPGVPIRLIESTEPDWTFQGFAPLEIRGKSHQKTNTPGANASLSFSGTGIALWAIMSPRGAKLDVVLDGRPPLVVSAWEDEHTHDEVPFHVMDLTPGPHRLRLVVRDDSDPRSTGHELVIRGAVAYGPGRGPTAPTASRRSPFLMR
jgi:ADP-ribosylglycohydrolase